VGEVIGGQLGGHRAPGEGQAGAEHRHRGERAVQAQQHVGEQAGQRQPSQHQRQRAPAGVGVRARGRAQAGADHAQHDRAHSQVLAPPGVLAEHPLTEDHQHRQAHGQRGLHHDQRRQAEGQ